MLAMSHREPEGISWGYGFDVQTRWGYYPAQTPNAVATAFAIHALADLESAHPGRGFGAAAQAAVDFAQARWWKESHFAYYEGSQTLIHNANMLVAGAVARVSRTSDPPYALAHRAMMTSVKAQARDGSWVYGDASNLSWIDGFHTAYMLDGLRFFDDAHATAALARGVDFYRNNLIDGDGAARASTHSRFPIETHAAATAMTVLVRLAPRFQGLERVAEDVLSFALRNMMRRDGRFVFRVGRWYTNRTPYLRWNDAHMALALSEYLGAEK